jgi:hypothetical protein
MDRRFKFAFVRNPFDQFVSFCAPSSPAPRGSSNAIPRARCAECSTSRRFTTSCSSPQHAQVTGPDGNLLTNHVGRVEQMQQSYDEICEAIGIPTAQLEQVNASSRRDYQEYYDQPLIDGVAKLYARDLELFDYQF